MKSRLSKNFLIGLIVFGLFVNFKIIKNFSNMVNPFPHSYKNCNVILIHVVPLRADHLGCYGYDRNTSPNLDKMAQKSSVFMNNFTSNSMTITSFMTLISSLYPASHGVFYVAKDKLSPRINTLAQVINKYGYTTAWFGPAGHYSHLDPEIGVGRGFDTLDIFPRNLKFGKIMLLDWLETNKNKKFFLVFHSFCTHDPYTPSLEYKNKFIDQNDDEIVDSREEFYKLIFEAIKEALSQKKGEIWDILGERVASRLILEGIFEGDYNENKYYLIQRLLTDESKKDHIDKRARIKNIIYWSRVNLQDQKVKKYMESLYDALILEFDTEIIGSLLKELKKLNLYNKTIIVFCGTHGEEFGEHGGYGHGTLYNEVTRVPLIIKVPGEKRGRQIQELTETVDIMPTLLDLLEIPIPHHAQGKSLAGSITEGDNLPLREYVFGQTPNLSSIQSKEWKLIFFKKGKKYTLYHLMSDPTEQHDLYQERKDVASALETELKKWEESLPSYVDKEYPFLPGVDKAAQERIKKTGYW